MGRDRKSFETDKTELISAPRCGQNAMATLRSMSGDYGAVFGGSALARILHQPQSVSGRFSRMQNRELTLNATYFLVNRVVCLCFFYEVTFGIWWFSGGGDEPSEGSCVGVSGWVAFGSTRSPGQRRMSRATARSFEAARRVNGAGT